MHILSSDLPIPNSISPLPKLVSLMPKSITRTPLFQGLALVYAACSHIKFILQSVRGIRIDLSWLKKEKQGNVVYEAHINFATGKCHKFNLRRTINFVSNDRRLTLGPHSLGFSRAAAQPRWDPTRHTHTQRTLHTPPNNKSQTHSLTYFILFICIPPHAARTWQLLDVTAEVWFEFPERSRGDSNMRKAWLVSSFVAEIEICRPKREGGSIAGDDQSQRGP